MKFDNVWQFLECDDLVRKELEAVGAKVVMYDDGTAPSGYLTKDQGNAVAFNFTRKRSYWQIDGVVALAIAQLLYKDPVGQYEIRAMGDAGARPPESWVEFDGNGSPIITRYHIDSPEGLALFVHVIRENGLADPAASPSTS